jgi:hypothetical protein
VAVLAGLIVLAWQHELRPSTTQRVATTASARPQPRPLTAEEEQYATSLWEIHRQVTPSAVAMSFAGIVYETGSHDARLLENKIEPVAKFFAEAESRVHSLHAPASLAQVHSQYLEAMALYRQASNGMLQFTKDGERQHLSDAHDLSISASQGILRAGEVLWPGQYKPH